MWTRLSYNKQNNTNNKQVYKYRVSNNTLIKLFLHNPFSFPAYYVNHLWSQFRTISCCVLQCPEHIVLVPAVTSLICENQPQSIFFTFICIMLNPGSFKQTTFFNYKFLCPFYLSLLVAFCTKRYFPHSVEDNSWHPEV